MSQGKLPPFFCIVVFRRERSETEEAVRLRNVHVHVSCCMSGPVSTAQSPDDDTHAVGTRRKWAREHGLHLVWSILWVGCKPGTSIGARSRTRANVNVRPRPLVEPHTCHQPGNHTTLYLPSHFLSLLLSLLGSLYSPVLLLFIRSSLSLHRPKFPLLFCTASSVIHLILSLSLSTRLVSSSFAHLRMLLCLQASRRHIQGRFLLSLLCSLISPLFSSYLLLSSHFSPLSSLLTPLSSHCSLLSSPPLVSSLPLPFLLFLSLSLLLASFPSVVWLSITL